MRTATRRDSSSTAPAAVVTRETATPAVPLTGGCGLSSLSDLNTGFFVAFLLPSLNQCEMFTFGDVTSGCCFSVWSPDVLKSQMVAAATLPPASSLVQ